jgi:hypothetical protein
MDLVHLACVNYTDMPEAKPTLKVKARTRRKRTCNMKFKDLAG